MPVKAPRNFSWFEPGRVAGLGWPNSGDNLRYLIQEGICHLVSLSPECTAPIKLLKPKEDGSLPLKLTEITVEEFEAPSFAQISVFIEVCKNAFEKNQAVGVHCWMGRGRTGTFLACYLIYFRGLGAREAVAQVRKKRPESIETSTQENFVHEYHAYLAAKRMASDKVLENC